MDPNDINSITLEVEKDLVAEIIEKLKENKLSPEDSKSLAKEFLSHLPPRDLPTLVDVLRNLTNKYQSVREVYAKYYALEGDMQDAAKIHAMATHINNGNIEQAIEVAKGGQGA